MTALDNLIQVNVTSATTAVATESFAIPLIMGSSKPSSGDPRVKTYSDPSDLITDGYATTSIDYIAAQAMFSQSIRPTVFKLAQRTSGAGLDADIAAAEADDSTWYGVVCPGATDNDILSAATQIEGMNKIGIFASANTDIGGNGAADLASQLKAKTFTRSGLIFSPGSAALGIDAAIVGKQLPKAPGSSTWFGKTLDGIEADALTPDQQNNAIGIPVAGIAGKNVNIYQPVGGINIFECGVMSSGMFIDLRIGTDSLRSMIKTNIFQALQANEKVPYTDQGAQIFASAILQAIKTHQDYGFLDADAPVTVTHTPVALVSPTVRAQRISPPFKFSCRTSGAIHAVRIEGSINI